jgi:hypothetical protein
MRCLVRSLIVGAVAFICLGAHGQSISTPPTDIYADFVGTWVGVHYFVQDNAVASMKVKIEVTESKKKDHLHFAYTWGEKGRKGFERGSKWLTLKPSRNELDFHWDDDDYYSPETYKVTGLDEFAKTGYGSFIATGMDDESRYLFKLGPDDFEYEWDKSLNGQPFSSESRFRLSRESPMPGAPVSH